MKEGLVLLKNNIALTTTLIVSKELERPHKTIIKIINDYMKQFEQFGSIKYHNCKKQGHFENDTTISNNVNFYYLNEEHLTFLIMMLRVKKNENDKVLNFKIKITRAFSQMKNIITELKLNHSDEEWKKIREESKKIRLEETNQIKNLVEYAKKNGSNNAEKYYTHYSNLIWKYLFDVRINYKNKIDILSPNQLHTVMQGEHIIKNCIAEGIENNIDYHKIYDNTRDKIKLLASLIEITRIPQFEQVSML